MNAKRRIVLSFSVLLAGMALAAPTRYELTRAMQTLGGRLQAEEAALKDGTKTRAEVADEMLELARASTSDAEKLLLFKAVAALYVSDGNEEKALETLKIMQEEMPDLTPQHVLNVYGSAVGKRKVTKGSALGDYVAKMMSDARPADVGEPPRVVKIYPPNGDTNVNPKVSKIVITFNRPMDAGCSFDCGVGADPNRLPEATGAPQWSANKMQITLPVRLRPGCAYEAYLNREGAEHFRSVSGKLLPGMPYAFKTSGKAE